MTQAAYIKNVVTLTLDTDKCSGCTMCIQVCPHHVLEMRDGKAHIIDKDLCMECGACEMNCSDDAIHVNSGTGCASGLIAGALKGKPGTCECGKGGCC